MTKGGGDVVVRSTSTKIMEPMGEGDVVVCSESPTTVSNFASLIGGEGKEVRRGDDRISSSFLATASEKIISDSDVINSLDCLPLVDDGDRSSADEN